MEANAVSSVSVDEEALRRKIEETLEQLFLQVANIDLQRCQKHDNCQRDLCTVYTTFYGGYEIRFAFCAERALMKRIVEKMLDEPVDDPVEIIEYMEEFINILCGHVVASVFRQTKISARFYSPCFVEGSYMLENAGDEMVVSHYINEHSETASLMYDRFLLKIHEKENGGEKIE